MNLVKEKKNHKESETHMEIFVLCFGINLFDFMLTLFRKYEIESRGMCL